MRHKGETRAVDPFAAIPCDAAATLMRRWLALSEMDRDAIWQTVEARWLYSCRPAADCHPNAPGIGEG